MSEPIQLIVFGAAGRMGQAVLRISAGSADFEVAAALVREGSSTAAELSPKQFCTRIDVDTRVDVVIDFSGSAGFDSALELAIERRIPLVSGSTGLSEAQHAAITGAANKIAVLQASNFSLGIAVLAYLAGEAARLLPDWDCEILEAHHRHKLDAPSGTALTLGQCINASRGRADNVPCSDRSGERDTGTVGYSVSRAGDIIGEHEVRLAGAGERLELIHRAGDRDLFARGALTSARWIVGKPPGIYQVADVLGLKA